MYVYKAIKDKLYPEIDEMVEALKKADNVDESSRDVRPLMATIAKMTEVSPRLGGLILKRQTAVNAWEWKITPLDPADLERAEAARKRLRRVIASVLNWHHDTPMFGVSLIELDWVTGGLYGTTPQILKRYHPTELEQNGSDPASVSILEETDGVTRRPLANESPQSFIVGCAETWLRGGIIRGLVFHEILQNEQSREWANFNRKLKGVIQATHKEWASDPDKTAALAALKGAATHNYALTSDAVTFAYHKIADAAGSTSFKDLKGELASDAAIRILGQANSQELPEHGGSRAAVEALLRNVAADIHWSDTNRIRRVINDQLLLHDFQINVAPSATEVPWEFDFDTSEEVDREAEMRIIADALEVGLSFNRTEVYDRLGYSIPKEGDDIITGGTGTMLPPRAGSE